MELGAQPALAKGGDASQEFNPLMDVNILRGAK